MLSNEWEFMWMINIFVMETVFHFIRSLNQITKRERGRESSIFFHCIRRKQTIYNKLKIDENLLGFIEC